MSWIYRFGGKRADGSAKLAEILGGKGAGLAEMTNIGIPVPPGFTISTKACVEYLKTGKYPKQLEVEVKKGIKYIEQITNKEFGNPKNPLLLSVRSGAKASMPGMMDTVLNLGLNDQTTKGLAELTKNEFFALDSYRRFIEMFTDVVMRLPQDDFDKIYEEEKQASWHLIERYKEKVLELTGKPFIQDPYEQLWKAIIAVFESWNNPRAKEYRKIYKIPEDWGTAVNVQAMVFGNMGETSATGVVFTRDPATGEKRPYGEYLINAQGEDIVAGIRTPLPIEKLQKTHPQNYRQLLQILKKLEHHYKDVQDVEFTIERNRLWILQTRRGKRTPKAAVKIAYDMAKQGLISKEEAVLRISPDEVEALLHPMLPDKVAQKPLAKGLPASPGAVSGKVIFSSAEAVRLGKSGEKVILLRPKTSAEDVAGMAHAVGFLTATGGMTSHAAVVARGMGKPCIVGCEDIMVDEVNKQAKIGNQEINEGEIITIDGTSGSVYLGKIPTVEPELSNEFKTILKWADSIRKLKVRANADTPQDATTARKFGAEGIGLCRTEHMFFGPNRISAMREMILAPDTETRKKALAKLLPMQKEDFKEIFRVMNGLPVTIRTLDPPLHEFLPKDEQAIIQLAQDMGYSVEQVKNIISSLKEDNPMLGFRGCRLGIAYPEITEMQVQAIIEAACEVTKEGVKVFPEIMIPLVSTIEEFINQKQLVIRVADEIIKKHRIRLQYLVGTMIEVPRAALIADEIAKYAQFFSFGTNDMTQTVFGFSRDDAGRFLPLYIENGILANDPFEVLDTKGVGEIVKIAVRLGRSVNPKLKVGICGEHGGNPESIEFFHKIGLDYVSCSAFRVCVARLASAHANLKTKEKVSYH
ncbi:MAG: pyruvate, phosphate dikinase [candidate division WOR-3 bacterium]|nr:pyruvate, phosphate dikinase [candidate division WOR-3 bacterium]